MYHFGWMLGGYFLWLTVAAIISTALGIWVLRLRRFRGAAVALVALGLLIRQWWLLQFLIVMAFMKFRGFAP